MELLSTDQLKQLAEIEGNNLVSLYIPTREPGDDTQQNPIRLKNQLQKMTEKLEERGFNPPDVAEFLSPIVNLSEREDFWQKQSQSLALFLIDGQLSHFQLPVIVEEQVVIGNTFQITPLLQVNQIEKPVYLLALSLGNLRLFGIEPGKAKELELGDVPSSLEEAMRYDDPEKQLQHRSSGAGQDSKGSGFHGHGGGEEQREKNILRYFQMVDKGIRKLIEPEAWLLLAGVDYLLPIYRQANEHPQVLDQGISESADRWSADEVHARSYELMSDKTQEARAEALERFRNLADSDKRAEKLDEIISQSYGGQVETLFLRAGEKVNGTYDLDKDKVEIDRNQHEGSEDLLNMAARFTLLRGGKVYPLANDEMPVEGEIAAILRY